jgi:AcrR family transcriptional regulator
MPKDFKQIWIDMGYCLFAEKGLNGLKIEVISQKVGISKSSFYHHFADLPIFIDMLLDQHIARSKYIAQKEDDCNNINPELIELLIECKTDLFFNRQLRINRANQAFNNCLEKSNQIVGNSFIAIWSKDLGIQYNQRLLEALFGLALENFYLQITPETLTEKWLLDYFQKLRLIVIQCTS